MYMTLTWIHFLPFILSYLIAFFPAFVLSHLANGFQHPDLPAMSNLHCLSWNIFLIPRSTFPQHLLLNNFTSFFPWFFILISYLYFSLLSLTPQFPRPHLRILVQLRSKASNDKPWDQTFFLSYQIRRIHSRSDWEKQFFLGKWFIFIYFAMLIFVEKFFLFSSLKT